MDGESPLAIEVRNVFKHFGRGRNAVKVLKGINMDVPYHTIYALLGASGCGKTTLLRCCLGFIRQSKGSICVMGNYPGARGTNIPGKDLGYMPQDIGLVYELSIMETMYLFGLMFRMGFGQVRERAEFLADLLELPPLKTRIRNMSGGEQRRVSFAVSLIQKPALLIMDEPTVGMDSLLRQSVWQYIRELTVAKECTVVITTHYIDEARRANTVGLMRNGKLLTQSKPEDLIMAYRAVTLEEVFVKLAYKQEEDEEKLLVNLPGEVDNKLSVQAGDNEGQHQLKSFSLLDRYFPRYLWGVNFAVILAITLKATVKTLCSLLSLIFLLTIPVGNVVGLVYFIGGDIRDIKVFYHNDDNSSSHGDLQLAGDFVGNVSAADEFDTRGVGVLELRSKIEDGEGPLAFKIGQRFTDSLYERHEQFCRAHLNPLQSYPSKVLIDNSTITLVVDSTDAQLFTQSMIRLHVEGVRLLDSFYKSFHTTYNEVARPQLQLVEEVHGSLSWEYSDYIGSATLTAIVFVNSIAMTSMNFVLERKEGLFERSYSAGASVFDFLVAYSIHASVILLAQVILLIIIIFGFLGIERAGNLFLYTLLIWLTSMTGSAIGLLLSSQVMDEISAQNSAQMIGGTAAFVSGNIWPIYGQPIVVRTIGMVLPVTQPTTAASAIGSKGLGLADEPVYVGFITALAWLLLAYTLSIALFRTE